MHASLQPKKTIHYLYHQEAPLVFVWVRVWTQTMLACCCWRIRAGPQEKKCRHRMRQLISLQEKILYLTQQQTSEQLRQGEDNSEIWYLKMWYLNASNCKHTTWSMLNCVHATAGWLRKHATCLFNRSCLTPGLIRLRSAGRDFKADFLIDKQPCSVKKSLRYVNKIYLLSVAIVMALTKRLNNGTLANENAAKCIRSDNDQVKFAVKFFVKLRWLTINRPPQSFCTMMRLRKIYSLPIKIW